MNKTILIENLVKSRKLSSGEEYKMFEESLMDLQKYISIEDVDELCKVFIDDTKDDEVMFSLIHMIEQFRGEEYLQKIAICTPRMIGAHDWAMTLNKRILNSQQYFNMYINVINKLNVDDKAKILDLLEDIKNDNPKKFSEKVDIVKKSIAV